MLLTLPLTTLGCGMNLSNARAKEVLELCLANENPEMRSLVYEIINASGLDPSDPMFLVLALTGQIKVFLEAAPTELRQILIDWKKQNAESLAEIMNAVVRTKESRQEWVEAIEQTLKRVSLQSISALKEAGMTTTGAIAEANSETLDRVRQTKGEIAELTKQLDSLHSCIQFERQTNKEVMTALIEKLRSTTNELNRANKKFEDSILSVKKLQQQISWSKRTEWFTPLFALLIMGLSGGIAGATFTSHYFNSHSEKLGRNITKWNQKQLIECIESQNTECTIRLVP